MSNLKEELAKTKDLLMNLQSFTMQTNKKLVDVVFNDNMHNDNHPLSFISMEGMMEQMINHSNSNAVVEIEDADMVSYQPNLKEMIEKELDSVQL